MSANRTDRPPLIGVFPRAEERSNGNGHALFAQTPLMRGIQAAGAAAIMLSPTDDPQTLARYIEVCDGFLIPGGGDIDPSCYGEARLPVCGPAEDLRDAFETELVPRIVEADKPLLGICRGHQLINVALGGNLWQDIPSQPTSTPIAVDPPLAHRNDKPWDLLAHTVAIEPGTLLERVVYSASTQSDESGAAEALRRLPVNSLHHQSVNRIGRGLVANAFAPDGTVEGLEMPGKRFVLSVQWHPEFMWEHDPASMAIIGALVEAARG